MSSCHSYEAAVLALARPHVTALKPLCWHWHVAGGVVGGGIEGHSSEAAVLALSHR
jgi:hypothetical protein